VIKEKLGMLMIQMIQGYLDDQLEMNKQTSTEGNHMVANGPGCEWQVGLQAREWDTVCGIN
jgi:hypothetical protein